MRQSLSNSQEQKLDLKIQILTNKIEQNNNLKKKTDQIFKETFIENRNKINRPI
jgi:hypothetical protein